jgi:outer membrane protein assembly factor BamA
VRGFGYGTLGPYENFPGRGERPAGGYSHLTSNFEYIYRVNDPIRLVAWADVGRAFGYKETFDVKKLRYTFGGELRLFLPVFQFPLRFIYAINPSPEDLDEFEGFQFTIGNTF